MKIIHESPIGNIQFKKIRNGFIKNETNLIFFKLKKTYNKKLQEEHVKKIKSDILNFYNSLHKNKTKFIQIYDLTETETSTVYNDISFVKDYGNFLQDNVETIIKDCCIGTSILVNSIIIKSIANSCLFLYRHVSPTHVHTSINESYEWLGKTIG